MGGGQQRGGGNSGGINSWGPSTSKNFTSMVISNVTWSTRDLIRRLKNDVFQEAVKNQIKQT